MKYLIWSLSVHDYIHGGAFLPSALTFKAHTIAVAYQFTVVQTRGLRKIIKQPKQPFNYCEKLYSISSSISSPMEYLKNAQLLNGSTHILERLINL